MSLIPTDLYRHGKSTFALERRACFLEPDAYGDIIATSVGLGSAAVDNCYVYSGVGSGFTTKPFVMHSTAGGDVLIATELQLDGCYAPQARTDKVVLSDGVNRVEFYNTSSEFNANTLYTTVLGGVTKSGTVATYFGFSSLYATGRNQGTQEIIVRCNYRFRVDKNRGEISLWLGDQIKGVAAVTGLENLGTCTWQYVHTATVNASDSLYVKQIGLRLEC